MPINVFGNTPINSEHKIDTKLFVQKPYLRTNYIESNLEEDVDLINQVITTNLQDPTSIREPASKNYVDNLFNDSSILKNTTLFDLNDRNITKARCIQVNQFSQIDSHLTPKLYVDNSIGEQTLARNNQDNDFTNRTLTNTKSVILNKQAENDNEVITKAYVDQFHQENEQSRRDLRLSFYNEELDLVKNNQDNDLIDKKITNLDSVTVNRNPVTNNEVASKKYVDDSLSSKNILGFNQTVEHFLKRSVGDDVFNLTKNDKTQITDITTIQFPNVGGYLLQSWKIECNDINNIGKIHFFIKSIKKITNK